MEQHEIDCFGATIARAARDGITLQEAAARIALELAMRRPLAGAVHRNELRHGPDIIEVMPPEGADPLAATRRVAEGELR